MKANFKTAKCIFAYSTLKYVYKTSAPQHQKTQALPIYLSHSHAYEYAHVSEHQEHASMIYSCAAHKTPQTFIQQTIYDVNLLCYDSRN